MNPYIMMSSNAIRREETAWEERRRIRRMENGIMPRKGVVQRDKSWQTYLLVIGVALFDLILFVRWWTM